MSTFDLLAVSARSVCRENFLTRMERIAKAGPAAIVLREKGLSEREYAALAEQVLSLCGKYRTPCILHGFVRVAESLNCGAIHLPLAVLRGEQHRLGCFRTVGVSVHSADEAREAQRRGASYVTAGHIFATDCKKGLAPRGLSFLKSVSEAVSIPVYAIGGITPQNVALTAQNGAKGACVMSGFMRCGSPEQYLAEFRDALSRSGGAERMPPQKSEP